MASDSSHQLLPPSDTDMCTWSAPEGSSRKLPLGYTPSDAHVESEWLSIPCLTWAYSVPSWKCQPVAWPGGMVTSRRM
jgi:hypothetical protein